MTRRVRTLLCSLVLALLFLPSSALASHFRGGSIDWSVTAGNTVAFTVLSSWRTTFIGSDTLRYGDGASDPIGSNGINVGTFTDSTGLQYTTLRNSLSHAYSGDGPWATWYGSCCRIAGMGNGSSQSYRVEATVHMAGGNTGGPAIAAPAIIQMVRGAPQGYAMPVVDPDAGDTFTCAPSTTAQSSLSTWPSWLSVSTSCVLTGTPPTGGSALWAYSVRVTDSAGASSTFDGMIELVNGNPPVCTGGGSFTVPVGTSVSVPVTGTDSTGSPITFTVFNGPTSGTLSPTSGPSGTTATFDWTPTAVDFGQTYAASIIIENSLNLQASCPLALTVPLNLPPTAEANGPYVGSKSVTNNVTAIGSSDPDGTIVLYEWDCDGDGTYELSGTAVNNACGPYSLAGTYTTGLRVTDDLGVTDTDATSTTVPNVGPTADAGGPYTVNQGVPVTIDGSASTDGDGGALTFSWDCDTSDGTTYAAGSSSQSCSYPDDGSYTGVLQVCDPEGDCDTTTFQVTSTNTLPTAVAGGPYATNQGIPITLNGSSSSDVDGVVSSYQWDCDLSDGVAFSSPSTFSSFTCTYPDDGSYTVTLRVTDDDGGTGDDSAVVTVSNTVAIADAGGPYTGTRNVSLTVDGSGSSDSDGTIASYQWDCDVSDSIPASAPSASPTFSCIYAAVGAFTVQLVVTDDDGATASATTTATITNTDPTANAGGPYTAIQGVPLTLDGSASSDSDGSLVSYEWDCDINSGPGYSAPSTSATFVCSYASLGSFTARIRVTDDDGSTDTASGTVIVSNQTPIAEAGGPYIGSQGVAVPVFAFGSSDPDDVIVLYEWDCDLDGTYEISTTTQSGTTCTYATVGTYTAQLQVTDSSGATDTDTASISIGNQAPIANAAGPYAGLQGVAVTIDGSASADVDGTLVDYAWDCDASDGVSLVSSGSTDFDQCTYSAVGTFTVTLQVTDDDGATSTATTSVVVSNGAPVAVAGGPYTGNKGTAIAIDGTQSSDADGTIVDYAWDCDGDGISDINNASGLASCTFANLGTYTITLVVTDNNGGTGSDTATITVPLVGPIADAGGPYVGIQGGGVPVDGSLSYDSDGAIVQWEWDCDGDNVFEQSSASAATAVCTPPSIGSYTVQLRVTDDDGAQDVDSTVLVVSNLVPVADAGGPYSGSGSAPVQLDASGSTDLDGFIASYSWDCDGDLLPDVVTTSPTAATCTFAATGTYTVTLTVIDGDGGSDVDTASVVIASLPPIAVAGGPYTGTEGTPVALNGAASSDSGGTIVQWEWDCDSDGTYDVVSVAGLGSSCTFGDEGNFVITMRVTDDDGDSTLDVANVSVSNVSPTLLGPVGPATGDEGQQLLWSALASDPGTSDTLTYSWAYGDGATDTGQSVNHTYLDEGVYTVEVTVDDGDGGIVTNGMTVTVSNVAPVLSLTAIPSAGDEGQLLSFSTSATDAGTGDTLTYAWDMGDGNTVVGAAITYAYTDDGAFTVTVTVSDDAGATDSSSSVVVVGNVDPVIDSLTGNLSGFEGQLLSWTATASDAGLADVLSYAWDFGDGDTATGTQADHSFVDEGQYVVTLTVTDDDGGSSSQTLTVVVGNVAPVIASLTIPPGDEGTSIAMTVVATDSGVNDTITYTWDFGDGVLGSGPSVTHTFTDDGTFYVEVMATDNAGASGVAIIDLLITNVDPVISSMAALPSDTPDEGDEIDLVATATDQGADDIPDLVYAWDLGDGTTLFGDSVEHTYVDDGVFTVTLTVDDQDGGVVTSTMTVTAVNVAPVIASSAPTNAQQDTLYSYAPSVQDPGDEVFTWTLSGTVPAGMTFDSATGEIEWTPDYADFLVGSYAIELSVDDGDGGSVQQAWTIVVFSLDTDGDGMPDDWEDDNGLDPLDPTDAADDPDADGITNLGEFGLDQDPWVYDGPSVPVALSPIDGADVTEISPDLTVQNATDPQGEALLYDFELYLDEALTQFVTSGTAIIEDTSGETTWSVDVQLVEDTEYWWIARANDVWTPGPWTDPEAFTLDELNDAPDAPVLIYPVQGQFVTTLEPTLEWSQTADPNEDEVTYDVEVYELDGVTLVASGTGVLDSGNTTSTWMSDVLGDDSSYLWTARAVDDEGLAGDWADFEEFFVTTSNEAPDTPSWVAPEDLTQVESQSPNLVVTEVTDPEAQEISYRFDVDTDPGFASADLISNTVAETGTGLVSWDLDEDNRELTENVWIFAKVTAIDSDGIESPPAVISFFVRGPNDAPDLPTLLSPEEGSSQAAAYVVLLVGVAEDVEGDEVFYDFVLARDAELTDIVFEANGVVLGAGPLGSDESSSVAVSSALAEGEYFWSARSIDDGGAASEFQVPNRFLVVADGLVDPGTPSGPECGCSSGSSDGAPSWLVALLPMALLIRRRRS